MAIFSAYAGVGQWLYTAALRVAGNNCKFTTSGIVDPAYARPEFNWLRLIALGIGPYSG